MRGILSGNNCRFTLTASYKFPIITSNEYQPSLYPLELKETTLLLETTAGFTPLYRLILTLLGWSGSDRTGMGRRIPSFTKVRTTTTTKIFQRQIRLHTWKRP